MGAKQIIVTNINYPDAISLKLPKGFTKEHAFYARYFGLKQVIESRTEFPICLHDHDFFNAKNLPHSPDDILVGSVVDGYFSEQAVVYPEKSKKLILDFVNLLWTLKLSGSTQTGYGTEYRHEGSYSTEQLMVDNGLRPFERIPIKHAFNVYDQVSFEIVDAHSLDENLTTDANRIPSGIHGVHGHLNKGKATDALLNWLAQEL